MMNILKMLEGGDRRSIGRVDEVVEIVRRDPSLFEQLIHGLFSDELVIRMRSADALEKITSGDNRLLQPFKPELVHIALGADQQEVRWHMAQMLPRLQFEEEEKDGIVQLLMEYLRDSSRIVQVSSIQALADFANLDENLRQKVIRILGEMIEKGSPAVKARARKLLSRLRKQDGG